MISTILNNDDLKNYNKINDATKHNVCRYDELERDEHSNYYLYSEIKKNYDYVTSLFGREKLIVRISAGKFEYNYVLVEEK